MTKLSYNVSGSGKIAAVANGSSYTITSDHPHYKELKECLKTSDADRFVKLADIPKTINEYGQGQIKVSNGQIYYADRVIHNSLTKRILWMMQEEFEIKHFLTFLENLMQNPSKRAVSELYNWMEHQDIPITTDGCWIGYKYLNKVKDATTVAGDPIGKDIYLDVHSGTIRQWIGKVVEVPRNTVDDNWGVACSEGLHVGSSRYQFSGDVKVLVKVNPKDVVSVPNNEVEKCRVCKYEIVDIHVNPYNTSLVGPQGEILNNSEMTSDSDFEDDDEEGDDYEDGTCDLCGEYDCDGSCEEYKY